MPSYLSSPVANLRSLEININTCDETVLGLWSCLLQRSPNLKSFKFSFPMDIWFNEKWVNLKRAHEEGNIPEKICEYLFYF
jgi:hypothetical protein